MSNITNTNKTTVESILTNTDLVTEYMYGLDSTAEATSEDSDDATAAFNATDIFWRSTTDNTTNQNDTYYAGNGDDELFAGTGNDYIVGRYGDDDIFGGAGKDTLFGGAGNDDLYGGTGIDTSIYEEQLSDATITKNANGSFTVSVESGDDTLLGVERLKFANTSVAMDLDGNAGEVAKLIGAIIGPDRVADKALMGIGIDYMDNGGNFNTLVDIALNYMGATTNGAAVDLLYTNLTGATPSQMEHDYYVSMIENTDLTLTQLAVLACETDLNAQNINLVGLTSTGVEYTPFVG